MFCVKPVSQFGETPTPPSAFRQNRLRTITCTNNYLLVFMYWLLVGDARAGPATHQSHQSIKTPHTRGNVIGCWLRKGGSIQLAFCLLCSFVSFSSVSDFGSIDPQKTLPFILKKCGYRRCGGRHQDPKRFFSESGGYHSLWLKRSDRSVPLPIIEEGA